MTAFLSVTFRPAIPCSFLSSTTMRVYISTALGLWKWNGFPVYCEFTQKTLFRTWRECEFEMLHYCWGGWMWGIHAVSFFITLYLCHIIVLNCNFNYVMIVKEKWRTNMQTWSFNSFTTVLFGWFVLQVFFMNEILCVCMTSCSCVSALSVPFAVLEWVLQSQMWIFNFNIGYICTLHCLSVWRGPISSSSLRDDSL